ncbi:MAG: diguanylate cyclase [Rhodospirillales bacterium 20-60-12]|nr:MAG: diguanylate cyclase [Rhodospirillales bacterium 20-60-12]
MAQPEALLISPPPQEPLLSADLHADLLTIDTHVDIPWPPGADFFAAGPRNVDLPKLRAGRVGAVCFAAYVPQGKRDEAGNKAAQDRGLAMLEAIAAMAGRQGETVLARKAADIEAAHKAGLVAIIPAVENGTALGGDLSLLDRFAAHGVRYMTLTHNGHNALADAAIPLRDLGDNTAEHGGLSALGRQAVGRMNQLGMLVDVSHLAKSAMLQAADLSATPILATHSCVRALCDHPRNLDDEQLDVLRRIGGLIQITMVPGFLRPKARAEALSVRDIADHIDYVAQRIGIAHVGIGSDFDGGGGVSGFMDASSAPALTAELVRRGYDDAALRSIWGGNFLRLLRQAEAVAGSSINIGLDGVTRLQPNQ